MTELYPASPKEALSSLYLGQDLRSLPAPAAILDLAAVRRNCERMLSACDSLDLEWRAHVKTHKTVELTRLQIGSGARPAKIVVSTLSELEFLLPLFLEYKSQNRPINVLYGLPLGPSQIPRLASAAKVLGPDSISILLDHPSQLTALPSFLSLTGGVIPMAHIKIDMGGRRSGVVVSSPSFDALISAALTAHSEGLIKLSGLYSHAGHSYGGDSQIAAMSMLRDEIVALMTGASAVLSHGPIPNLNPLTLSVGATPTALSIQNMCEDKQSSAVQAAVSELHSLFRGAKSAGHIVEIHAGVYPTLDLQQLAAHSLSASRLGWSDIAFTVLAEVCSLYPGRGALGTPEALVGAGGLALGRETCKAYPGMALVSPWGRNGVQMPTVEVEEHRGWMVGRFAQEHGILTWSGEAGQEDELEVGQKLRLWPNHACITSSHFGWYFVVDSDRKGKEDEVVDVWLKARGW